MQESGGSWLTSLAVASWFLLESVTTGQKNDCKMGDHESSKFQPSRFMNLEAGLYCVSCECHFVVYGWNILLNRALHMHSCNTVDSINSTCDFLSWDITLLYEVEQWTDGLTSCTLTVYPVSQHILIFHQHHTSITQHLNTSLFKKHQLDALFYFLHLRKY